MANILPLLNATNSQRSKRKCLPYAQKAAPTCTISLTSVSVSAQGSSDSFNFIPFPSAPVSIPASNSPTPSPRPRVRTQSSPLRKRRSLARLVQPPPAQSSSPVELERELVSPAPRKRPRKASFACPSFSAASSGSHASGLSSLPQRKNKPSRKVAADLRFLCTIYRSIAWMRVQREFSDATKCLMKTPDAMEVDLAPISALDAQESLMTSRLRSYLIFNEMSPQWLDVTPLPSHPFFSESDQNVDALMEDPSHPLLTQPHLRTPPPLPILTPEQVTASLLFRFRHRSKGKSRPEAVVLCDDQVQVKVRKRSPLAGAESSWGPEE